MILLKHFTQDIGSNPLFTSVSRFKPQVLIPQRMSFPQGTEKYLWPSFMPVTAWKIKVLIKLERNPRCVCMDGSTVRKTRQAAWTTATGHI